MVEVIEIRGNRCGIIDQLCGKLRKLRASYGHHSVAGGVWKERGASERFALGEFVYAERLRECDGS
jgi:hypothetical protein